MRVSIYARYSSDKQREASIEDQVRLCEERAARAGWRVVKRCTERIHCQKGGCRSTEVVKTHPLPNLAIVRARTMSYNRPRPGAIVI
jgi:Resolvase, N terminal domain